MLIEVLKSKLHCVTVTEANINYMGSITIDEDLLDAANIYKTLKESLDKAKTLTLEETRKWVINEINAHEGLEVEYFSIVDGLTLTNLDNWNASPYVVGCITVYCGETPIRLIDHIKYKG